MNKKKFEAYIYRIINTYKFPVKAKVVKTYTEKGKYYIDCRELDENDKELDIVYPKVELPKILGGQKAAILCMPSVNSFVTLGFYNGNKHLPFVLNVLGTDFDTEHNTEELIIIQNENEVRLNNTKLIIKIGTAEIIIDRSTFRIGGDSATEKAVLGDTFKTSLDTVISLLKTHTHSVVVGGPGTYETAPSTLLSGLQNPIEGALSNFCFLKG